MADALRTTRSHIASLPAGERQRLINELIAEKLASYTTHTPDSVEPDILLLSQVARHLAVLIGVRPAARWLQDAALALVEQNARTK